MAPRDPPLKLRIRDVVLDLGAYELRRDGRAVRLERQPMDLLILLVERRGHLVRREEIVDALWGKDVFVDVETGVHTAIRKVRQALRDSPEAPTFIETVPGRGYRFVAPVEVVDPPSVPQLVPEALPEARVAAREPEEPLRQAARAWARPPVGAAVVVVAVAAMAVLAAWSIWRPTSPTPAQRITIAVLPFEAIGPEPSTAFLADGLTEDTIVSLGRVDPDRVSVIGRTSMFLYRGPRNSSSEVGRELGADYLVEGSLRSEAGRLRVTARLIRAADQFPVWSDSLDAEGNSMLDVQRDLSRRIAEQVGATLSPDRSLALDRRHSRNQEAFNHFLRGRASFNLRTPAAMRDAVTAFRAATEADPGYALAWAGLAVTYAGRAINSDADPREMLPLASQAATRAIRADPDLPDAQNALAFVYWLLDWQWPAAEGAFRRAVALDPSSGLGRQTLGHLLSQMGRHAEGLAQLQRARELDPLDPVAVALSSQVAYQARDYRAALTYAERAIELNAGFWFGYQMRGQAQLALGLTDAALLASSRAMELSGRNSKPVSLHGYTLARAGRASEARALLASLEARTLEQYVPPYTMALIHAGLGDGVSALDWLERAYAVRDVHLIYLPVDPKWDPYRTDPGFIALLARCGFPSPRARPPG
jgi:TolB-like protein/DNA-binding winged helix-turn-helix (wHTH) protein/Tfp pilus assembly protein PilF